MRRLVATPPLLILWAAAALLAAFTIGAELGDHVAVDGPDQEPWVFTPAESAGGE